MKQTPLFIISGPSGVGKGTLIRSVLAQVPQMHLAISATTRPPRQGEVHGQAYYFISDETFDQHIKSDAFLEWCQVHQNRYGTLKSEVFPYLGKGSPVLLEIDIQGTEKLKAQLTNLITIFIAPPDLETLNQRLSGRNTENASGLASRLLTAGHELKAVGKYDYIVTNNDLEQAVREVREILLKES